MGEGVRIALALGGGGARGIAHIGVLRFFEEVGFSFQLICGTSIGAIVGGRYAQVPSWKVVWEGVNRALDSEAFEKAGLELVEEGEKKNPFQEFLSVISKGIACSRAFTTTSLVSEDAYFAALREFFPQETLIEETRIGFAAVATDLLSGREVVITRGSLVKAVAASASIPGIFPPIPWGGMLLTDGGWVDVLPAAAARLLGADFVVGVWVGKRLDVHEEMNNAFDVVYRADDISRYYLGWLRRTECDVIIEPDVGSFLWNQFSARDELFERGYEAAKASWEKVRSALRWGRVKRFFVKKRIPEVFNPVVL